MSETEERAPFGSVSARSLSRTPTISAVAGSSRAAAPSPALWLAVYLPQLPLDSVIGVDAEHCACVLVDGAGAHSSIALANRAAVRLGIRSGMRLGAAHALGAVRAVQRAPASEAAMLARLCAWAWQFTPTIDSIAPDVLLLEVRGSLALFGGLRGLSSRLRRGLRELGMRGFSLAAAPTPLGATWLARARRTVEVDSLAALPAALAPLPIEVLQPSLKQLQNFYGIGVRTVGECCRLPRGGLARRFAPELLHVLDRALGKEPDPRAAFVPPERFTERLDLPWEVSRIQTLTIGMERLLHVLGGVLRARRAVLRTFCWVLHQHGGAAVTHRIELVAPSRDVAHLAQLTREYFARRRPSLPVLAIELAADDFETECVSHTEDLFRCGPPDRYREEHWPQFLERLRARLGSAALKQIVALPDHRPERATCAIPIGTSPPGSAAGDGRSGRRRPRPPWLLREPLPLSERDGRPLLGGALTLDLERERIQGGWWEGADLARDYFVARDPGGTRWWIFRELGGRRGWYLHGVFD